MSHIWLILFWFLVGLEAGLFLEKSLEKRRELVKLCGNMVYEEKDNAICADNNSGGTIKISCSNNSYKNIFLENGITKLHTYLDCKGPSQTTSAPQAQPTPDPWGMGGF